MRARLVVFALVLGGCSLVFDGSRYESADASMDASGSDAGPPDAGLVCDVTQPCCDWMDCEGVEATPYCVHDATAGTWSCQAQCVDDGDCAGFFAGDACIVDLGERLCGCASDADCTFPGIPFCDQPRFPDCVECRSDGDCAGGRTCVDGFCEG